MAHKRNYITGNGVCQLLDKDKYPATKTSNGITWTNNGDGTITADGTATGGNAILNVQDSIAVVAGHKYLVSTDYTNQVRIQLYTTQGGIFAPYSTTNVPQIITCIKNYNRVYYQIVFINGVTVSDAILKPQLFDLTEMYGADNEPTTVEQFREKFPDELYPYNRLVSTCCKKMIKVANVCQLVDKSKYSSINTVNGITFTKNKDDGTITVNGTATNRAVDTYVVYLKTRLSGKVLLTGCPSGGSSNTYYNYVYTRRSDGVWITGNSDYGSGCFFNYGITAYNILCQIIIEKGTVCNNLVFKPQLFDLTEMYGAGNKPTTVAEFREKFPDELYSYQPYCFAPIMSTNYIGKTKNLFDNIPVKTNYIINSNGEEVATSGYNIYGKMYGNNFTISTNAPVDLNGPDNWLRVCLYNSGGTFITRKDFDFNIRTVANISDDNIAYIQLCFHRISFSNYKLQVELGSTATPYVPYGHV